MAKILLIDDDEPFRLALTATLEGQGYEVLQADSGAKGVQLARDQTPDLVLCDVNMSGVSGHLTLYALRRDPKISDLPFVMMSGFLAGGDAPPGIERGADGFLTKPFSPEQLVSTIQTCLNRTPPVAVQADAGQSESSDTDVSSGLLGPLNQILQTTAVLRAPRQPKEIRDLADQAYQSAVNLRRRIEHCLVYAEIERLGSDWQQMAALWEHRTGIRAVVEPVAREKAIHAERTADLVLQCEDALLAISVHRLRRIAEELLDNAFRYSPPGSVVTVQTAPDASHVTLTISDRGRGMTPEQIVQAGATVPLDQLLLADCGSGLIIARRLTELHGGTFSIRAEPGNGAVVSVSLPKAPAG